MSEQLHYHESVLGLLESIAKLDNKLGPTELIDLWFSDLYFPGQKSPGGYSKEVWEKGQREWTECFTAGELRALAKFNEVYKTEVKGLSNDWGEYQKDPGWLRVAKAAQEPLKALKS